MANEGEGGRERARCRKTATGHMVGGGTKSYETLFNITPFNVVFQHGAESEEIGMLIKLCICIHNAVTYCWTKGLK